MALHTWAIPCPTGGRGGAKAPECRLYSTESLGEKGMRPILARPCDTAAAVAYLLPSSMQEGRDWLDGYSMSSFAIRPPTSTILPKCLGPMYCKLPSAGVNKSRGLWVACQ